MLIKKGECYKITFPGKDKEKEMHYQNLFPAYSIYHWFMETSNANCNIIYLAKNIYVLSSLCDR